jgi:V/A-type H+/Na+-transporting ATPase subunit E
LSAEALRQEIRKTAQERAREALESARVKSEMIIAEADKEAKNLLQSKARDAKKRIEQMRRADEASARMHCTTRLLSLQSRYVEEAFRQAGSKVMSLPTNDPELYETVLKRLTIESFERLGRPHLVAAVRDSDVPLLERILEGLKNDSKSEYSRIDCSISAEPLETSGGILVHTDNMKVYYVNTFESILLSSREALRARVIQTLLNSTER